MLVELAKRREADRLAESLGGDAKLRGEREARANDDLGTLKIALDARRADFLNLGHFGKQPVADIFELLRVVAAERDRDVPAAPATAAMLRLEVDASIGNRSQPRRAILFELGGGELAVLAQFQIHCRSEEHTSELQS